MKIILFPNEKKNISRVALAEFIGRLSASGCEVLAYHDKSELLKPIGGVTIVDDDADADLMFVLGGDGTMIRAARRAAVKSIPMLGINYGNLGYMTEIEADNIGLVDKVIKGDYRIGTRMMIDVTIKRGAEYIKLDYPALNDAVISNGPVAHLLSFDLYCDGILARSTRGDGIVIATPTGSTAYSMSAGGPVLDPCLSAMIATYVCPHSFGARSVVFSADSVLTLKNLKCRSKGVYLTIDGIDELALMPDDEITFTHSLKKTYFVKVNDEAFLGVLRRKMSE